MKFQDDWESSLDYTTSGLRMIPLDINLLYNYAGYNEKLGRFDIARDFFDFCCEIRPRWSDALFGQSVTYFKEGDFKSSKRKVKQAIANYKKDSLVSFEEMIYFRAMCYKNLGKFDKSIRDYHTLSSYFHQFEAQNMMNHLCSLILLSLKEDKYVHLDYLNRTRQIINTFSKCAP